MTEVHEHHLAAARAAWPGLEVDLEVFRDRVAAALAGDSPRLHAADLYLACACAAGDPRALAAFEHTLRTAARSAVRRVDPAPHFADEVLQALRARLLVAEPGQVPRIASYAGRGPLTAWLRVAAVRLALQLRETTYRESARSDDRELDRAVELDPQLAYVQSLCASDVEKALRRACDSLDDRARAVLRLSLVESLSIDQIGRVYGVHRATAARWISRARGEVLARVREDLSERLSLSESEFDSVVRLVRSQLDISVSSLLGAGDPSP